MRINLLAIALVSLLTPLLCGCVLTGSMWSAANATEMSSPDAVGVILPSAEGGSQSGIVVRYTLTGSRFLVSSDVFMLVPIDGAGIIGSPCCIAAEGRTPAEILTAVTDKEKESLRAVHLVLTHPPKRIKGYIPSDPLKPEGSWHLENDSQKGVEILVIRQRANRSLEILHPGKDESLPEGSFAVIVPSQTTRPPEDASSAKLRAALLTPLTLPADLFVTPAIVVLVVIKNFS